MLSASLEAALQHIEKQFEALSAALVSGEPRELETASLAMRQAGIDLSSLIQGVALDGQKDPQTTLRLKSLADGLAERRESLLRRIALVERQLHTILPVTQDGTYTNSASVYGSSAKSSGVIKRYSS